MKYLPCYLLFFFISVSSFWSCEPNSYAQGQRLYELNCQNCHLEDGKGLRGLIPPLAGSDYWEDDPANMACFIIYGMAGEIVVNGQTYNQPMPGNEDLTATQITNIINYVGNAWGNDTKFVSYNMVESAIENCIPLNNLTGD